MGIKITSKQDQKSRFKSQLNGRIQIEMEGEILTGQKIDEDPDLIVDRETGCLPTSPGEGSPEGNLQKFAAEEAWLVL